MMRRRLGLEHVGARSVSSSASRSPEPIAAGLSYAAWCGSTLRSGTDLFAQLLSLGAGFAVAVLVYVGARPGAGLRELEALLLLRARRDDPSDPR